MNTLSSATSYFVPQKANFYIYKWIITDNLCIYYPCENGDYNSTTKLLKNSGSYGSAGNGTIDVNVYFTTQKQVGTHSLDLNSLNKYIKLPQIIVNNYGVTFSFWFKTASNITNGNYGYVLTYTNLLTLAFNSLDYKKLYVLIGSSWYKVSEQTFTSNNWFHVAYTIVNNSYKVYINNVLSYNVTHISNVLKPGTYDTGYAMGTNNDIQQIQVYLDDFRFYNTALNAVQIKSIYEYR